MQSKLPILGICYGMQLLAINHQGKVKKTSKREYGNSILNILDSSKLFNGIPQKSNVWMSHGDKVIDLPEGFQVVAKTDNSFCAAFEKDLFYGVQFHPEVDNTDYGKDILKNFALDTVSYTHLTLPTILRV